MRLRPEGVRRPCGARGAEPSGADGPALIAVTSSRRNASGSIGARLPGSDFPAARRRVLPGNSGQLAVGRG